MRVLNPSQYPRTEVVLYGTDTDPDPVFRLPKSVIAAERVSVPALYQTEADSFESGHIKDPNLPYILHPLAALLSAPRLDGVQLGQPVNVYQHRLMQAFTFRTVEQTYPDVRTVVELTLYIGSNEPWAHFSLTWGIDSKKHARKLIAHELDFSLPPSRKVLFRARPNGTASVASNTRLTFETNAGHAQRFRAWGVILPIPMDKEDVTHEQLMTMLALHDSDLEVRGGWQAYGPFGAPPLEVRDDVALSNLAKELRFGDPNNSLGATIDGHNPSMAGWQPFQTVGGKEALTDLRFAMIDKISAARESLRPIHYIEDDGSPLDIAKHPDLIFWDAGRPHYNSNVSPDRLGIEHDFEGILWRGFGNQHADCGLLAAHAISTGDLDSMRALIPIAQNYILLHTLPSKKPNWPTTGTNTGRALGRWELVAVNTWLGTGLVDAVVHAAKRVIECGPALVGSKIRAYTLIGPNDNYFSDRPSWRVWEDAIFVTGRRALQLALQHSNFDSFEWRGVNRNQLLISLNDYLIELTESLMLYGFNPQLEGAWCLDWTDDGATYDFNDPKRWAVADGGIINWMYPAACIGANMLPAGPALDKAIAIRERYREEYKNNWQRRLNLGAQ